MSASPAASFTHYCEEEEEDMSTLLRRHITVTLDQTVGPLACYTFSPLLLLQPPSTIHKSLPNNFTLPAAAAHGHVKGGPPPMKATSLTPNPPLLSGGAKEAATNAAMQDGGKGTPEDGKKESQ